MEHCAIVQHYMASFKCVLCDLFADMIFITMFFISAQPPETKNVQCNDIHGHQSMNTSVGLHGVRVQTVYRYQI